MEEAGGLKRSKLWEEIYQIVNKLDVVYQHSDCTDKPSVTTLIEKLFLDKISPLVDKLGIGGKNI